MAAPTPAAPMPAPRRKLALDMPAAGLAALLFAAIAAPLGLLADLTLLLLFLAGLDTGRLLVIPFHLYFFLEFRCPAHAACAWKTQEIYQDSDNSRTLEIRHINTLNIYKCFLEFLLKKN
jgi:hypothetical protein